MAERPLRADARRNRDAVLAAARRRFAEHGYAVPLDDIAASAPDPDTAPRLLAVVRDGLLPKEGPGSTFRPIR